MTVNKIPFNEAADIIQDRYHEEGKPYSFAVRRMLQTTRNFRTQGVQPRRPPSEETFSSTSPNTNTIQEQTQNQRAQKSSHPITQQEDPGINLPDDHCTQTDRQIASQQSQNLTATVNQAEVPKPPYLKQSTQIKTERIKKARRKPWKMKEVCNFT